MRVYQLAEELGMTTKELIQKAKALKIVIKGSVSNIDENTQKKIRERFSTSQKQKKTTATQPDRKLVPTTEVKISSNPEISVAHRKTEPKVASQPIAPIETPTPLSQIKTEAPHEQEDKKIEIKTTPIIPSLLKDSDEKTIRALRATELDYYSRGTSDKIKEGRGKIIGGPVVGKQRPFIKKTFFFKKKTISQPQQPTVTKPVERKITLSERITLKELCEKIGVRANIIIKKLMGHNILISINDYLSEDALVLIGLEFNYDIVFEKPKDITSHLTHTTPDKPEDLKPRPPVITFMGHVDHGKTSLMDKIRATNVAASESGAITQHLGAYEAHINDKRIVFIDTPGHEAFTQMRARGANVTDIIVLVVAVDDGVMPQTEEAISHAKAANLPIIVAINKIDKKEANIHKVKQQLSSLDLVPEDWGGKTIFVEVSALTGQGVEHILEMILLQAEMMDLKANPNRRAYGTVLEARLTDSQGPLTTILIQNGTLKTGDFVFCSGTCGRIRSILHSSSQNRDAGPSTVARITGLSALPMAGDKFYVVDNIKTAAEMAHIYNERKKAFHAGVTTTQHTSLENLYEKIVASQIKDVKIIIKTDVQGSLEVISQLLNNFSYKEVQIKLIHKGAGQINESDVLLAHASDAIIIGFNTSIEGRARILMSEYGVEVKTYNVIYSIIEDMKLALEGMLEPEEKEVITGKLLAKNIFKISRIGIIAGCMVTDGKIERSCSVRVYRDKKTIYTGKISSLKRFKDDVREVNTGFECGLRIEGFNELNVGDVIEAFTIEKQVRKLSPISS
ncbi:MAG: translation initiation factor IF-2 [Planctomycetota bacterium]|nr:translation initiation factor IF-2 [Planctomycetota bacterium]MDI6786788.1 translation initiation factor IF-2 [Planctomycetota bacterium]